MLYVRQRGIRGLAKGKYGARSENRVIEMLEADLKDARKEIAKHKEWAANMKREWVRLLSIEKLFADKADVLAELERVKKELDDAQSQNLVYRVRLDRWAEVMMHDANADWLKMSKDIYADLLELGYFKPRGGETRSSRRVYKSPGQMQKRLNIAKADRIGWGT